MTDALAIIFSMALLAISLLLRYYTIRINGQLTAIRDTLREIRDRL